MTQESLIKEFFINNSQREISHPEIVDWLTQEHKKRTGRIFRDPDRGIRKLYENGFLIKVKKGAYKYDPDFIESRALEDFTQKQKDKILARDNYQCVICGQGKINGVELHADHIKPKDLGGKATIENGQTLCSQHNFLKKNLRQTETGKKMFIKLYNLAKKKKQLDLVNFCEDILNTFDKHKMNGHIEWATDKNKK